MLFPHYSRYSKLLAYAFFPFTALQSLILLEDPNKEEKEKLKSKAVLLEKNTKLAE